MRSVRENVCCGVVEEGRIQDKPRGETCRACRACGPCAAAPECSVAGRGVVCCCLLCCWICNGSFLQSDVGHGKALLRSAFSASATVISWPHGTVCGCRKCEENSGRGAPTGTGRTEAAGARLSEGTLCTSLNPSGPV